MNILVFPHLGLGDQFVMNGYVQFLLKEKKVHEVCIIAKQYQQKTLEHLYSDFTNVSFYWIRETNERSGSSWEQNDLFLKSINHTPFNTQVFYKGKTFYLHNFGCHTTQPFHIHFTNWADAFYYQAGVDPSIRLNFTFPSNLENAKKLYQCVIDSIGTDKYILVHDDPLRKRHINQTLFKDITNANGNGTVAVLYLGRDRYNEPLFENTNNQGSNELLQCDSLLDYTYLIKNALECHFMDSSIGVITDFIKDSTTKLYNHQYITNEGQGYASSQRINILRNWTYL